MPTIFFSTPTPETADTVSVFVELMARHIEYVQPSVSNKEQLFFLDTKDYGWEPLCKILDKPIPNALFPRANDTEATEKVQKKVFLTALAVWLGIFAMAGGSAWWTWMFLKKDTLV